MKYIRAFRLLLLWMFCLLCISCKSAPGAEGGDFVETPVTQMEAGEEEPFGLKAAPDPAVVENSTADLSAEEETPDITLFESLPPELSGEFATLPEPVFPEPAETPEVAVAPFPAPKPQFPGPLLLDEPPILDIAPEPAPVRAAPPAGTPVPQPAPVSPPEPARTPPPKPDPAPAPPSGPPSRPRPVEQPSGLAQEPLALPTVPVPNPPAREPPSPPAIPPSDEEIEYSRIVQADVGQTIEIPFRGTGWVYLGELRSRPGVAYNSRRSESEGQTFIFRAEEAGTFGLKFYRQDYIRDYILNDHVQVIVSEAPVRERSTPPGDRGGVIIAPRWPYLPGEEPSGEAVGIAVQAEDSRAGDAPASSIPPPPKTPQAPSGRRPPVRTEGLDDDIIPVAPPKAADAGAQPAFSGNGVPALPEDAQPDEYFRRAGDAFEAGQVQPALAILDQFRKRYPLGSDEAWWLYGQFLEAAGPSRDIRQALDYYRRLVREYPQSPRCNEARGRIAYLERFYFNIR